MVAPLVYLKRELNFTVPEWSKLSEEDKEQLKRWAEEEQRIRGA